MTQNLFWTPVIELSRAEELIIKRACKNRKLFIFLRKNRHLIFDHSFQEELIDMYRQTGAGVPPIAPALLAMATLLQKYTKVSDNEMLALLFDSRRWQMVLGCLGAEQSPFGQSTFFDFRMRLISSGMDERILERTAQIARETGDFTKKGLNIALDSAPLKGHGKVEDCINLLGHAAKKTISCIAQLTNHTVAEMAEQMDAQLFTASSIKAGLDVNWSDPQEKKEALNQLYCEIESLELWLREHFPQECKTGELQSSLDTLDVLLQENLEPDLDDGLVKIIEGVTPDRQISISDPQMRHGKKSKSKRFNGFKNHIVRDLEEKIILGACTTAANRSDAEAAEELIEASLKGERTLESLSVDRQYLHAPKVIELAKNGVKLLCRAPAASNHKDLFNKRMFEIDLDKMQVTCPNGQSADIVLGKKTDFPAQKCDICVLRSQCTKRKSGQGRSLRIHKHEDLFQELSQLEKTKEGREKLRQRTGVEHGLARISQRQDKKARYNGTRKNTFELRMICAIQNLERAQYLESEKLKIAA